MRLRFWRGWQTAVCAMRLSLLDQCASAAHGRGDGATQVCKRSRPCRARGRRRDAHGGRRAGHAAACCSLDFRHAVCRGQGPRRPCWTSCAPWRATCSSCARRPKAGHPMISGVCTAAGAAARCMPLFSPGELLRITARSAARRRRASMPAANRRMDAELCLVRLCQPDASRWMPQALNARLGPRGGAVWHAASSPRRRLRRQPEQRTAGTPQRRRSGGSRRLPRRACPSSLRRAAGCPAGLLAGASASGCSRRSRSRSRPVLHAG